MAVYSCLAGLLAFPFLFQRPVVADVSALLGRVEAGEEGLYYREGLANISFFPGHGWALTMAVQNDRRFAPGRIAIFSRLAGKLTVELLIGIRETRVLTGEEAEAFAARVGLPLERIDTVARTRFPAGAGRKR